ncbi:MAG TPA: hypothetical protein H9716_12900 [Candidatus Enterocloster faecavium]|uniref:Uncharacterized protein n=1 Tax=Candidatus Enterocloster faecavium TaxID=2838560 RepID=A0A9D2LAD8_9FIRM|nr:hypothetical protein [Candidatus Enterocloster faecavium]
MKKIVENLFMLTLIIFVVMGTVSVLLQAICVVIGNGAFSVMIADTVLDVASKIAGICGTITFLYLMMFGKGFGPMEEGEEE